MRDERAHGFRARDRIAQERAEPDREERRRLAPQSLAREQPERRGRRGSRGIDATQQTERRHRRALVVAPDRRIDPALFEPVLVETLVGSQRRVEPAHRALGERTVPELERQPRGRGRAAGVARRRVLDPADPARRILARPDERESLRGQRAIGEVERDQPEPGVVVEEAAPRPGRGGEPAPPPITVNHIDDIDRPRVGSSEAAQIADRPQHVHKGPQRRAFAAPGALEHAAPLGERRPLQGGPRIRRRTGHDSSTSEGSTACSTRPSSTVSHTPRAAMSSAAGRSPSITTMSASLPGSSDPIRSSIPSA